MSADDFVVVISASEAWNNWYTNSWRKPTEPVTFIDSKGRKVVCWFDIEISAEDSIISQNVRKNFHSEINCTECRNRVKTACFYRGKNFAPLISGVDEWTDAGFNVPTKKVNGITIITRKTMFPEKEGVSDAGVPWEHFNVWTDDNDVSYKGIDAFDIELTVHEYIPLVTAMFEKHSAKGIIESLALTIDLLEKEVTYGKNLLDSTKWVHKHMIEDFGQQSLYKKSMIVIGAIIDAKHFGRTGNAVLWYHQFNNTVTMLMENAHNKEAFIAMTTKLLSPDNYQRRTGEASEGNLINAYVELGDFTTTHMTLEQARELDGALVIDHKVKAKSTSDLLMGMINDKKNLKSTTAGFADKCKYSDKTTLQDLMEEKTIEDLEVYVGDSTNWLGLYDHDLYDKMCYPWLWAWKNNRRATHVGLYEWVKVDSLIPGHKDSRFASHIYIMCRGGKLPPQTEFVNNCLIEEYLLPSVRRSCGKAFAQLSKVVQALVPEKGKSPAVGLGACVASAEHKLMYSVKFRIGNKGKPFTVTHRR